MKYLTVSVHDFSPKFEGEFKEIFYELDKCKIRPRSVLVVPNFNNKHDISKNKKFLSWIEDLVEQGDEIVLHGLTHECINKNYSSLKNRFVGEIRYKGDAEFLNEGFGETLQKVISGKNILSNIGVDSKGFIAPCWKGNGVIDKVIVEQEFKYTTSSKSLILYENGHKKFLDSKVYEFTAKPKAMDLMWRPYNSILKKIQKNNVLARVPIHPHDLASKKTFEYILKFIDNLKKDRNLVTYDEVIKNAGNNFRFI